MPVFHFDFNHSCTGLNLSASRSGIFTPGLSVLELEEQALRGFNEAVQQLDPGHAPFTADQIAGAARRVLRAATKGQESTFIKVRMRRAGEIRAVLRDTHWHITPPLGDKMRCLLGYIDSQGTLIPNDLPIVGLLDDAILVDVAMDALRTELDEYADFCRFRVAEAARLDVALSAVDIDRERWMAERAQERRLEQQLKRVRGSAYTRTGQMEPAFRIC
jgi:hypothetical protein